MKVLSSSGAGFARIELARESTTQGWAAGRHDVFAQLEILEEAEAKRLVVVRREAMLELEVPAVDDEFAFGNRADGGLPLIAIGEIISLYNAAAGKRRKPGLRSASFAPCQRANHPGDSAGLLRKSETMSKSTFPGLRPLTVSRAFGSVASGAQRRFASSTARDVFQSGRNQHGAVAADQFNPDGGLPFDDPDLRGEIIPLAFLHADAAKTFIHHAEAFGAGGVDAQMMWVRHVKRRVSADGEIAVRGAADRLTIIALGNSNERFLMSSA